MTAPSKLRVDGNANCATTGDGTVLLGSASGTTVAVGATWAFGDTITADGAYTLGEDLYIDHAPSLRYSAGKVGIGTTNPETALHIVPRYPGEHALTIGNPNVVGDDTDSGITLYGESAGTVSSGTIVQGSSNMFITTTNPAGSVMLDSSVLAQGGSANNPVLTVDNFTSLPVTAGTNATILRVGGDLTEAVSGTHPRLMGVEITPPIITGAAATVTDTATLYIANAPTATVSGANHALWVDNGIARFDGTIKTALTPSQCVQTDPSGNLTVSGSACGSGAGDLTDVLAGTGIAVTTPGGPAPTVAFDYTATLAGNPALNAGEAKFGTTGLLFEGASGGADTLEGLLTVTDPTADRTWTLPNVSGSLITDGDTDTVTAAMLGPNAVGSSELAGTAIVEGDFGLGLAGDVTLTSPTTKHLLRHDGGAWVNVLEAAGTDVTTDLEEETHGAEHDGTDGDYVTDSGDTMS
ncbi:MAG: hypothetical protein ACRDH5_06770, partial [bacterium]